MEAWYCLALSRSCCTGIRSATPSSFSPLIISSELGDLPCHPATASMKLTPLPLTVLASRKIGLLCCVRTRERRRPAPYHGRPHGGHPTRNCSTSLRAAQPSSRPRQARRSGGGCSRRCRSGCQVDSGGFHRRFPNLAFLLLAVAHDAKRLVAF